MKYSMFFIMMFAFSATLFGRSHENCDVRAALDVGSGSIRMQVALVNKENRIEQVLYTAKKVLPFVADLSNSSDNCFSEELFQRTLKTVEELKEEAAPFQPIGFRGLATAVFRRAANSNELFDLIFQKTGILIEVISQEEEAQLGFETTLALTSHSADEVINWDYGAGSFQMVKKEGESFETYLGNFGMLSLAEYIWKEVRQKPMLEDAPLLPLTAEEVQSVLKYIENNLANFPMEFLTDKSKIVLSSDISAILLQQPRYAFVTLDQLRNALDRFYSFKNEELPHPHPTMAICSLLLKVGVMSALGIEGLQGYFGEAGNTTAILVGERYWADQPSIPLMVPSR